MKIQDYLTAAAINLKRLAAAFFTFVMSLILAGARRGGDEKAVLLSQRHASVVPTQRPDNPTAKSDFFDGSEIDYT